MNREYPTLPQLKMEIGRYVYQPYCWYLRWFQPRHFFTFRNQRFEYFVHPYNTTWRNERSLEIPLARHMLEEYDPADVLEVGNVLSHYARVSHTILDKYEQRRGVLKMDVVEYAPSKRYPFILSISTIEHVGWDETPRQPGKHRDAVKNLRELLAPGGVLMMTVPLGYNPDLDQDLETRSLGFSEYVFFKRTSYREWAEAEWGEVRGAPYGKPFRGGNALAICIFTNSR
ncbi:MAG: hypothetical protein ACOYZ8_12680 [Chloroflexota bacterium]